MSLQTHRGPRNLLAVQYAGPGQIFFRRIIDEETAAVLDHRDDLAGHIRGNGRTAERRAHHAVFLQYMFADISRAMDHDAAPAGIVIETPVQAVDTQR